MSVVFVGAIDIEQVQRYVLETDKLREMLGASRLIDREAAEARELEHRPGPVHALWPVSGTVVYWSEDRDALLEFIWLRHARLEALGIDHVAGFLEDVPRDHLLRNTPASPLRKEVLDKLASQCRREKATRRGADARARLAIFAPCRQHGLEAANRWIKPEPGSNRRKRVAFQEPRRALISDRAEFKLKRWEDDKDGERQRLARMLAQDFASRPEFQGVTARDIQRAIEPAIRFDHLIAPDLPLDDEDPEISRREKSFLALIKADGDGLGRLVTEINWNDPQWPAASSTQSPASRASAFATSLDDATRKSVDDATVAVTWDRLSRRLKQTVLAKARTSTGRLGGADIIRVPVLPLLLGGDDLWILTRRESALSFALHFASAFQQRIGHGICADAARTLPGGEALTMSLGLVFAKAGFPFDPMFDLAGELLKSAKKLRKSTTAGVPLQEGCIDLHWLASAARESLEDARLLGYRYADGSCIVELTTRPWTLSELEVLVSLAPKLDRLPRRKLEQLEEILRRGDLLGSWAWKLWRARLAASEKSYLDDLLAAMPPRLKLDRPEESPWCDSQPGNGSRRTPLLDLLELREILRTDLGSGRDSSDEHQPAQDEDADPSGGK